MKLVSSITLLLVLLIAGNRTLLANQPDNAPISEDGLVRLLENKISGSALIIAIRRRGVAFEVTRFFEQEIKRAGAYLGDKGIDGLLVAIRVNFRPPANRPFRVTYLILKGHAIDLFLNRNITRQWNRVLSGKYFIVPNEVSTTLADLVTRFSDEFSGGKFFREDTAPRTNRRLAAYYLNNNKKLFVGSSGDLEGGFPWPFLDRANLVPLVNSLNDPAAEWRGVIFKDGRSDYFSFRRFSSRRDLEAFKSSTLQQFYLHLTKDYFPPDFAIVDLKTTIEEGCQLPERVWQTNFTGPLLRLNVAIIENVSSEPVSVGRFILTESRSERLRARNEVKSSLASQTPDKKDLFPPGILKPGESLVIPIELSLKAEGVPVLEPTEVSRPVPPQKYTEALDRLRVEGGLKIRIEYEEENRRKKATPIVNAESIERIMSRGKPDQSPSEYLYGPSIQVESVEINKVGYLMRRFNPANLFIISGLDEEGQVIELEAGSCPYVYTYSVDKRSWVKEGVILYGRNSKLRESFDELLLDRFDGRILIREEDPETSFLDSIKIRAIDRSGREFVLQSNQGKLNFTDGQYVELRQGDELIINFDLPESFVAQKYVLEASGYYEPYASNPSVRSRLKFVKPKNKLQSVTR